MHPSVPVTVAGVESDPIQCRDDDAMLTCRSCLETILIVILPRCSLWWPVQWVLIRHVQVHMERLGKGRFLFIFVPHTFLGRGGFFIKNLYVIITCNETLAPIILGSLRTPLRKTPCLLASSRSLANNPLSPPSCDLVTHHAPTTMNAKLALCISRSPLSTNIYTHCVTRAPLLYFIRS